MFMFCCTLLHCDVQYLSIWVYFESCDFPFIQHILICDLPLSTQNRLLLTLKLLCLTAIVASTYF